MTVLEKLPYVDGLPGDNQARISWILNGDLLNGSDERYGNDGNLNEAGVQIQRNVVTLAELIDTNDIGLSEVKDEILSINEKLGELADIGVVDTLNSHSEEIATLKTTTQEILDHNTAQDLVVEGITATIGVNPPENGSATIQDNLLNIKIKVGNEFGEDINGLPLPDNDRTGLIRKVHDVTTQVVTDKNRIDSLESTLTALNPVAIKSDVNQIRTELGNNPKSSTVYDRLNSLETKDANIESTLNRIDINIGNHNVATELSDHETKLSSLDAELNTVSTGIKPRLDVVETQINAPTTGIVAKLDDALNDVLDLQLIVGDTASTGLRKDIVDLNAQLGDSVNPEEGTIRAQIANLGAGQLSNASQIQDINVILGTSTTGLQGDSAKFGKSLYGDSAASDPVDVQGVVSTTKTLYGSLITTNEAVASLASNYNYANKSFSTISDVLVSGVQATIAPKLRVGTSIASTVGSAGVESINLSANLATSKTADVVLVNVGTYDYVENTPLGTISDAAEGGTAGTFYFELFKLIDSIVTATGTNRVILSNGIKTTQYGSTAYPAANTAGHKFEDYTLAIKEIAELFSLPVIDTANESGINIKNSPIFATSAGLTAEGKLRLTNLLSASINSK